MNNLHNGIDPSAPGQVVAHCSEDDATPDVGISIGLGAGKVLWIGTLLNADGGDFGVAFYDGGDGRIAAPFTQGDALVEVFADRVAPAIAATASPAIDAGERMRVAIDKGLQAFCGDTPDFTMSGRMRRDAADFILGQPDMWAAFAGTGDLSRRIMALMREMAGSYTHKEYDADHYDKARAIVAYAETMPATAAEADRFECMIYDAHLPSMTARFRIPHGLPFASGMYEIRRLRTPTAADIARWAHLPEPPDDAEQGDAA